MAAQSFSVSGEPLPAPSDSGLSFQLSAEETALQEAAHAFAAEVMRPAAPAADEAETTPWQVIREAARLGLIGLSIPQAYGGAGLSTVAAALVTEELFWGCAGIATSIGACGLCALPILLGGSEDQRKRYLPPLCSADHLAIGAMALTEPEAGSDVMSMRTTARRDGKQYILNGHKHFITNGGVAEVTVVYAKTDPEAGYGGVTAFVVEAGTPGMSEGTKMRKLGIRASYTGEVLFEDCRVPADRRLGAEGSGFLLAMKTLEASRPLIAAGGVGIARAAFEYARDYAKERIQFGRPIFDKQAVAFRLADMATRIEASRLLTWKAASLVDQGASASAAGSMAKLMAGDTAVEVATGAVQVLGGYGYSRDYPVEKWYRDAKIMQIYEGTQEVQRFILSQLI